MPTTYFKFFFIQIKSKMATSFEIFSSHYRSVLESLPTYQVCIGVCAICLLDTVCLLCLCVLSVCVFDGVLFFLFFLVVGVLSMMCICVYMCVLPRVC